MVPVEAPQPPLSRQNRTTLFTFLTLLLLTLIFSFLMIQHYLLAVLMGGILAMVLNGFYEGLLKHQRHPFPRLTAFAVTMALLLLILAPLSMFVTITIQQGIALGEKASDSHSISFQSFLDEISHWRITRVLISNPAGLESQIHKWIQTAVGTTSRIVLSLAASLPELLLQLLLACVTCYFLLVDGKRFLGWSANKIPIELDMRRHLADSFKNTAGSVILASIISATVQAIIMLIAFLLLDVPMAFLAAAATFIFSWIPLIGGAPIWLGASIYLYIQRSPTYSLIMIIIGIFSGLSDNFVRPFVFGTRTSLHPLIGLVGILGGIQMFGYIGVFLGPILMAILISLLQVWPEIAQRFELGLSRTLISSTSTSIGDVPASLQTRRVKR